MNERRNVLSKYGISVKLKILESGKTQNWLIEEVKKANPTMYVDSSVINKVLTGKISSGKIVNSISEILGIENAERKSE